MKISEQWLREWVDPALDAAGIAEALTLAGLEAGGIEPAAPASSGVLVAEVLAVSPHPTADKLSVCRVHDGRSEHQVVCGAPNVRVGLKSAYAPPGACLPGREPLAVATLRGVTSAGMLCSAAELGLGEDVAGILELPADSRPGAELRDVLALDDAVLDIDLTPNRGDCFCVLGIARELGAVTSTPVRVPQVAAVAALHGTRLAVTLHDPAGCPRYAGRVIRGLDPGARTPLWLRERLRRAGVRAIHPLVDVTNYVMLELGQPMHAFDLAKLAHGIEVRSARAGERLVLLDGQVLELAVGDLVIADEQAPVALAGVMGGLASAVAAGTTDVFLESAFFEPIPLAGVARRYRLHTDASTRFERGVDPAMQLRAIERATGLILDICGGEPGPAELVETAPGDNWRPAISLRPGAISRLIGMDFAPATVEQILGALGFAVERLADGWRVQPPSFRFDLAREADLIEELARVNGYDAIPIALPRAAARPALPAAAGRLEQAARHGLVARGYHEAITYSFIEPALATLFDVDGAALRLANPISQDMSVMRASLLPGLVGAAQHNLNRQHDAVRLFEIGMVFNQTPAGRQQRIRIGGLRTGAAAAPSWGVDRRLSDFFDLKQDIESLLRSLGHASIEVVPGTRGLLHPGQAADIQLDGRTIGGCGALHPVIAHQLDIFNPLFLFELDLDLLVEPGAAQFRPISRFPSVRRDLSVVVDEGVPAADCLDAVREACGELLRDLELFDVYRGQSIDSDKKSFTLGLIFQARYSTLTDDEVETAVKRALVSLHERVGARLRD